jgi:hypothetical protein
MGRSASPPFLLLWDCVILNCKQYPKLSHYWYNELHGADLFLRSWWLLSISENSLCLMEPEGSQNLTPRFYSDAYVKKGARGSWWDVCNLGKKVECYWRVLVVRSKWTSHELRIIIYKPLLLVVFNSFVVLTHLSVFKLKGWGGHVFVTRFILIHHAGVFVTLQL